MRAPAAGSRLNVLGVTHIYKATAAETGGSFSLWEDVVPSGAGAPPHTHSHEDGGGKVSAHTAPVVGLDGVMRLLATVVANSRSRLLRYGFVNGLPGFVTIERGDILQTTALEIEDGRVVAVYVVRNPDKLRHMAGTLH